MASAKKKKVFAQKQPPLSVAIRRILARYPDGQILKELLQNAEDAGASELRLILDLHHFGKEKLYDERLSVCQGPALLAYNDAMFTEDDWENIQKTEHSHKLIDPKKIGRFGIGFNSIYHLTDFPWIISGKMVGVFDPCERGIFRNPDNGRSVGGYQWDMTDDDDREQIKLMSDQFEPLKYNNFDPEVSSHFKGTLFRFPLRQQFVQPKDTDLMLSKVTYSPERIQELFKAFETDGDRLLLFLTSVHEVSLWAHSDNNMVQLYSVKKKIQFPSAIPKPLENIGNPCYYEAIIAVMQNTGLLSLVNNAWSFVNGTISEMSKRWAIVQYISEDPNIARFVSEPELNLLPWVGVASPLDVESIQRDGYISCFLPLLPDNESRTGLPIQVHGYFCLSDSRRSVLWPTAAAQNDQRPKWNESLVNKVIPCAYVHLLEQISRRNCEPDNMHAIIACLWPDKMRIKPEWENFVVAFYKKAANKKLFWSSVTNKWLTVSDAVFLDPRLGENSRSAIHQICTAANKSIVSIPKLVPKNFQDIMRVSVTYMSPEYICGLFKADQNLLLTQHGMKKQLLDYVLTDLNCSRYIKNVPLLPLADGSFISFNRISDPIYVSSTRHPRSLLPGLESLFLADEYCLSMSKVVESGSNQLCRLEYKYIPKLLALSIENGSWNAEKELEKLWQYINQNYSDNNDNDLREWQSLRLRLIPVLSENQKFCTWYIDSTAPVLSSHGIDNNICQWLRKEFGLKLALPMPYLKYWLGSQYILNPDIAGSALKVIYQVWEKQPHVVVSAVQKSYSESHPCFPWFQEQILISHTHSFDQNFLNSLPLFCPIEGTTKDCSLASASEAKCCCLKDLRFQVKKLLRQVGFSFPLISFDSNPSLIRKLNLKEMPIARLVSILLSNICDGDYYSINQETESVVSWVVAYYGDLKECSVTFSNLSSHLVLDVFRKEVHNKNFIMNKPSEYANFCALLQHAPATIWTKIRELNVIPCTSNHLHGPVELVMSCDFKNTCPYICQPAEWVRSECKEFLSLCQIRNLLSLDDLVTIAKNIQEEHREAQKPLDEKTTLKGFIEVMEEIAELSKEFEQVKIRNLEMQLPDSEGYLRPAEELFYDGFSKSDQNEYIVVHKAVHKDIAVHFGAKTLRDVILHDFEDSEEFGQEVDLVDRIKGLLQQYDAQSDLFQEFLQNADDAGATKIAFFLDKRSHTTKGKKGLLSENYKELQGNAILIYNNSTFTEDDIKGIQRLGVGSKADDAEKIGRFGAGFNCAHHYTDCPSFISDDSILCIFDPLQQFLNISEKRGCKYNLSCQKDKSDFRTQFPAVYNTYGIDGFPLQGGTMFRLPLGQVHRDLSLDKVQHVHDVSSLFKMVEHKMKKMMLFLRNVGDVSAYESDGQGKFRKMWRFQSETIGNTWMAKEEFGQKVHEYAKFSPLKIPVIRASYELILKQDGRKHQEKWLVCQRLGFDELPESTDFSKVKLLPVAGVATQLDNHTHDHSLFCSLPLPQTTEMPVSINGHFSLDSESRKNLFTTFEGELNARKQWNTQLLNDVAINAYLDLLEVLKINMNVESKDKYIDKDGLIEKLMKFWEFLPGLQLDSGSTSAWSGRKVFSNNLFSMFAKNDRCLFPCLRQCSGRSSIDWINLSGNKDGPLFPSHSSFQLVPPGNKFQQAFILLHELGIKICPCPPFILKAFYDASVAIPTARPTTVASYLREPWIKLTNDNKQLPCLLTDTVFQSEDRVLSVMQFLLESVELEESGALEKPEESEFNLNGIPLLVTCDKFLRYFSSSNSARLEDAEGVINLFSEHRDKFICKKLRCTIIRYLTQHEDAAVTALNLEDLYRMLPDEMHQWGMKPIVDNNVLFCDYPPGDSFTTWLMFLWCLIVRLTTDEDGANQFASLFKNYCLIPAKMTTGGPLFLFRIDTKLHVVHPNTWSLISDTALDGLPIVYIQEHFPNTRSSFFGPDTPEKLIDCLVYWNRLDYLKWPFELINYRNLTHDFLTYFSKSKTVYGLRNLAIFETFDGQIVNLVVQRVFTLDGHENLPTNGQNIWMSKALFLKKHDSPKILSLYKELEIGHIDLPRVYAQFIVPSFPDMTTIDQVAHLHYLHDCFKLSIVAMTSFEDVLQVLRETQFINDNNGIKKSINQFYDHTVPLFVEMCSDEVFLPQYFLEAIKAVDHNWMKGFLHTLGLKHFLEPEEHFEFAKELSRLQLDTNLEKIEKVSKLLLHSAAFLSTTLSESKSRQWNMSIGKMSNITFIPSKKINENFWNLYPSTTLDPVQLMKTNGSCASECHSLVWTVTRVLPDWIPQELYKKMSIVTLNSASCFDNCLEHFGKLLNYLFLAKLQQQTDDGVNSQNARETLKVVLDNFYRYLDKLHNKEGGINDNHRMKLMEFPLIVVEDGRHLTYLEMTVERLPTEDVCGTPTPCYAPFLYELPHLLHKYEDLFRFLRMQQKPCVWHYVMYLHNVHKYLPEDGPTFDPNLRKSILSVQQAMVTSADKTIDWDSIETLYLFSSDGTLHKSSELVFRDSSVALQTFVPENNTTLKFWECSPNLDSVLLKKMAEFVELLPDRLKLKLSSEVLVKFVSVEKSEVCQYDQPCPAVGRLKMLLSSAEFLESIQRLYFYENNTIDLKDNRKWEEIHEKLQNIQIQCHSKLIIQLKDLEHSEVIENTDEECDSFLDGKRLHMSHEGVAQAKIRFACNLAGYIQQFLSMKLREMALCALFLHSEPCDLQRALDEVNVPALPKELIHASCLPILRNPVPDDLIHFLEMHPLNYFRNGDYVAFLRSDEEPDDDMSHNFIWAKIICCTDGDSASALCQHYKINIGDPFEPIIVSALDLHKFITQVKSLETGPLVATDIEPDSQPMPQNQDRYNRDLTEEEACKEVTQILEEVKNLQQDEYRKVLRRLLLTWHPDKNTEEKRALATVVFQHLQNEIQRLENGETSASETFASDQSFHSWRFFRSNTNQRWYDFSHGRSQNPFNDFNFHYHTPHEYPNPNMADKYWKTANDDLKAAFDARQCQNIETGKEIGNEHIIILAQQAVEKALKAALFAEIGNAEQHHDIVYLAQRVANRTRCSKDTFHKVSNFVSECGVDLIHLRYPDVPFSMKIALQGVVLSLLSLYFQMSSFSSSFCSFWDLCFVNLFQLAPHTEINSFQHCDTILRFYASFCPS